MNTIIAIISLIILYGGVIGWILYERKKRKNKEDDEFMKELERED